MSLPKVSSLSLPASAGTPLARPDSSILLKIFFAALAVRWIYALAMYALMGDDGLKGLDSTTYAANAETFARAIRAGAVHGAHWLGDAPYTMPLYQWLTTLPFLIFGGGGAISHILLQGALDSGTCILVYVLARSLDERIAIPSAIVAVLNPTQIVLSGLIYNDTSFTFFVTLTLFFAAHWTAKPSWKTGLGLGCALGCAALIRVSIAPWGFFAIGLLASYDAYRRTEVSNYLKLLMAAAILSLSLGIIAARNVAQFGTPTLTPQGGDYLALWVFPLAKETQDRTPYTTSLEKIIARTTERFGPPSENPFEQSVRYQEIGREAIRNEIQFSSLLKSWASGVFINLTSPAHLISPPVSQLPRAGFYGTPGNSFVEKVFNYTFRSGNAIYTWLLILGAIGLLAVRTIQIVGVITLASQSRHWPRMIFATSWIVFLLLLNGPIASPKYRLPLEPLFNIMTGAGLLAIRDRRSRLNTGKN
ncbi:4-amino-4-deoxy-L-arabinose transferase-like glycosyltransferase [Afipia massiliensis]|uniref:4-amino-4-deoxy-L-arabinose transferase-like glycosyltransferase n=1 Tax=Afipia massiliensis TaxID=211460 RepID=A0A840N6N0_9BRAD|nr:glycosyltransferase family 39 protein [Afipia massiliensis]MBB5054237.1 4-amino-4-deoxy-L-arabinose transferase-like glycosyltransferase [Afipia massiliensis]